MRKSLILVFVAFLMVLCSFNVFGAWNDNIIGYYKFENNLNDATGITTGTASNTAYTPGKFGQGYLFDGLSVSNRYVSVTNMTPFITTTNLTISFWTNYTGTTGGGDYDSPFSTRVGTASNSGFRVEFNGGDAMAYGWAGAGGGLPNITRTELNNGLNLLTFTFNFLANGTVRVNSYVNATLKYTQDLTLSRDYFDKLLIGRGYDNADARTWKGTIDELVILNKSVNFSEVSELWNNGSGKSSFSTATYNISFFNQSPSDVTSTSLFSGNVVVSYNISNTFGMNSTFINSTVLTGRLCFSWLLDSCQYPNTTSFLTFNSSVSNGIFSYRLGENLVYPSYRFLPESNFSQQHNVINLANANDLLDIKVLRMEATSNSKYNFFEVMANSTGVAQIFYCNVSYSSGNPSVNSNCVQIFSGVISLNHSHSNYSAHALIPFSINTSGVANVGGVLASTVSHFVIKGGNTNVYGVNISTGTVDLFRTSSNNGASYVDNSSSFSVDTHLHQFTGSDVLSYFGCINRSGVLECTTATTDNIDLTIVNPIQVQILSPLQNTYQQFVNISYLIQQHPNFPVVNNVAVRIDLLNSLGVFNQTIRFNALNTSYLWNIYDFNLSVDVFYYLNVTLNSSNGGSASTISEAFNFSSNGNLNVSVRRVNDSVLISNFSLNVTDLSTGVMNNYSSLSGFVVLDVVKYHNYSLFVDAVGFAFDNFTKSMNVTYNNHTFYLSTSNSVNFSFFDYNNIFLSGTSISFNLIGLSVKNYTVSTGSLYVDNLDVDDYEAIYSASGYNPNSYFFTVTNRSTQRINLFLLPSNVTTLFKIFVKDQNDNLIDGVTVRLRKRDLITGNHLTMGECLTNENGFCYLYIEESSTILYSFIVIQDGVFIKTTSDSPIVTLTNEEKIITLRVDIGENLVEPIQKDMNLIGSISISASNISSFTFTDGFNAISGACLQVYSRVIPSQFGLVSVNCLSGVTSGVISYNFSGLLVNNSEFKFVGLVNYTDAPIVLDVKYFTFRGASSSNNGSSDDGLFLTIIVLFAIGFAVVWIPNIYIQLALETAVMLGLVILGVNWLGVSIVMGYLALGIFINWNRKTNRSEYR